MPGEGQPPPPAESAGNRGALRAVLGNPNLRRVQLAFLGSAVGDWAYATAIVVWAYDAGGAALAPEADDDVEAHVQPPRDLDVERF